MHNLNSRKHARDKDQIYAEEGRLKRSLSWSGPEQLDGGGKLERNDWSSSNSATAEHLSVLRESERVRLNSPVIFSENQQQRLRFWQSWRDSAFSFFSASSTFNRRSMSPKKLRKCSDYPRPSSSEFELIPMDIESSSRPTSPSDSSMPASKSTHLHHEVAGTGSVTSVVLSLIKSFIGTGILFLPRAFYNGGLLFSCVSLILVAILSLYSMRLLLQIHEKHGGSFSDLGYKSFGKPGKVAVDMSLVLSQCAFCCAYLIFIPRHLVQVVSSLSGGDHLLNEVAVIWMLVPILIPLVWIRRVEKFAFTSLLGNLLILLVTLYIMYHSLWVLTHEDREPQKIVLFNRKYFSLFLGTAVYTFEGVGMVIPIQQSMKEKEKFSRVLTLTVLALCTGLVIFASVNYLAYGEDIKGPITLNMPKNSRTVEILQVLYCMALLCTYPLMLHPAVEILEGFIFHEENTTRGLWKRNGFRVIMVLITVGVAILSGDNFDNFVSLIGSLCCIPLAFIFPCAFHIMMVCLLIFDLPICLLSH
eukprot:TRINITY_DN757_c0_g1::TRINITY_DN757_c0_g1_i1::g.18408::m.18408 TRINITY_DN757_c0_g1::TRINITY_DN757_c0_g1_i1::g.18408  ORF type:complete len:552 (-),score=44.82,sp/Q10074/AVT3_SCHPO/33.85/2e-66,Aa_trans/PF01490.13/1.1e-78,Trp_Tyr_perm/PF03222.8/9e-06,MIP/PF00230.15/3.2e+03,MIP/PF00230.15/0.042,DUF485/PF04341.7/4.5e+03,DUF485/PF04341.7/1.3,DUF485/PF04341.7/2.8e+02 TRINITY_DN757_c0_g1_i1:101-1690(-)